MNEIVIARNVNFEMWGQREMEFGSGKTASTIKKIPTITVIFTYTEHMSICRFEHMCANMDWFHERFLTCLILVFICRPPETLGLYLQHISIILYDPTDKNPKVSGQVTRMPCNWSTLANVSSCGLFFWFC